MHNRWAFLSRRIICPDDGGVLRWTEGSFACSNCEREYRPLNGILDLLPSSPTLLPAGSVSPEYTDYYMTERLRTVASERPAAWGVPEEMPETRLRHKNMQVSTVLDIIARGSSLDSMVFCDITGGAGYYTFPAAMKFGRVLHCDLSLDGLTYASRKAANLGISNLFFLRLDYLKSPLSNLIDRAICTDTLIRGRFHEALLLKNIQNSLRDGGECLIDFHNWWHNPLRRLGLLPNNFSGNKSYSRSEVESILTECGITSFKYFPFRQEYCRNADVLARLSRLIPPTRLMYLFSGERAT